MNLKINFHKIGIFFFMIFILILPIDAVLVDKRTNLAYINYVILIYLLLRTIEILREGKLYTKDFTHNKLLVIFPIYLIFTIFFRQSELYSSFWILTFIVSYLFFFFSILNNYCAKDVKLIEIMIVLSSILVFLAVILFGNTRMNGRLALQMGSRTMDPNYFSVCLCLINSVCFYNILNKKKRIMHSIILIFLLLVIFMTGSRGGIIANIMALFILFCFSNIKLKNKIMFVIVLPIVILLFGNILIKNIPQNVLNRYTMQYNEKSKGAGRLEIWNHGLYTFKNNNVFRMIFGTGVGTYKYVTEYDGRVAHNMFIQMLVETGVVGEFMLIIIIFNTLKNTIQKKDYIVFASLCGLLIGAMSLDFINSRMLWFCLFLGNSELNVTQSKINKELTDV